MMSDASDMLAAALEQMDGIIAGSKALDYSNGLFDCQSPTSPFMGSLRALHLLEDLRSVLEMMDTEERESLRCQIPESTADSMVEWLHGHLSNGHISLGGGDHYQERLSRLESDKESLVLQVSVLTDQVEAQGEKIRDLDLCLEEHREKLNATEEMLQQELLCRTSLETQKLELMSEVSNLKLKLNAMEKERMNFDERFRDSDDLILEINELRYRLTDLESEKLQYEKKLKSTKEELTLLRRQLEGKDGEMRRLQSETGFKSIAMSNADSLERDVEVQRMKKAVESLMAANEEKDRKIEELKQSLLRYKKVQDMVMSVQGKKEKKDNECGESPTDGSSSVFSSIFGSVESEKQEVSDFEELKPKRLDELESLSGLSEEPSPAPSPPDPEQISEHASTNVEKSQVVTKTEAQVDLEESKVEKCSDKDKASEKPPLNPSATLPASSEEDSFGSRKARSSFGKGFFKIRGGKKTSNSPNLDRSRSASAPMLGNDLVSECFPSRHLCALLHKSLLNIQQLQLALQALGSEEEDNKGKLDYNWVTRWLDDIGLPQYKTQFDEGRVDGRVLHYMTVDDLLSLKVGSVLHHLSIKRAIQVLRLNSYDPNCLRRRPSDENNISPAEISQWTNHRVMEWLRSVDLAEYAPNLRGSGVHGGLMVLEPRFNVETMAQLLNIPPNKTLLRRHLATHFSLLIGSEAQQLKQECLENPDYILLTATTKVKPRKLPFANFGSLRKKKQDENEEYVCPMDVEMPKGRSFQKGFELQIYEDDLDRLEQMEDSEGTVRQIGAFSEGIQNLTSMLKDDEFFKEVSNSPYPSVTDDESNA
uniref:PTPRF interacting protein, binding protein 1 (Liprin beta 1) n=1 Tax=Nothobranchius kuhntae TaxID=321403 RepID=A0A1A8KJ35_NOTKU